MNLQFNLVRQKSDNYKKKQPEAVNKIINDAGGEKTLVADFEMFFEDYPFNLPILLYDVDSPHVIEPLMPFIAIDNELWCVKGFIHVSTTEINIICVYGGIVKALPMAKTSKTMDKA